MSTSAERTLRILEYIAEEGLSPLNQIAADLELNKATAFRLLGTLIETGYAQQDPVTRQYGPTTKVVRLGNSLLDRVDLRDKVRPHLESLASVSGETVHLAALEGLHIVYLDKIDGNQAVTMKSRVGNTGMCHSTALGKSLLANQPEEVWRSYVEEVGLPAKTSRTVTDPDEFYTMLESIRSSGFSVDDIENEEGLRCVAAPIRDHTGRVVAAVSISGWTLSMTPEHTAELVPALLEQADKASADLGFRPAAE